ncbi:OLC1v1037896C1 [Oldenlandia corymbosa var. corymbosa]|uniref:OLC1v1037896C1 n=1 Tax=Oldenlandia corymbosa var. corymbosa TaxID=529605 RepID=A0AAV1D144_OLDCO|nr:OLC1v1037896C1 [Oldenlandia corymbosa var. corymbosa]
MVRKKQNSKMVWRRKEAPPPPPPPWTELPRDLIANILQRLDVEIILEDAQRVCTTWRSVCTDPSMWRKIDLSLRNDYSEYDAGIMCKHLVDRSQGQLADLRLGFFATDALLAYIAERSGQLRYLSLDSCDEISGDGLTEAIKRFPLLEELHLFHSEFPSEFIETVGHTCPLLKSFSIGSVAWFDDDEDIRDPGTESNKLALAIAKTMPGLRHLSLVGNTLTNEGLVAILDGCTHLELLDLRGCLGVNLEGDIGMRCSQQVKCVKLPKESISDLEMYDSDAFEDYRSLFSGHDFMSDYEEEYFHDYEDDDDFSFLPLWAALDSDDEDFLNEDYLRDLGPIM